jgi:ABC-type nitrate/sulfonate/bicarbonate transport system substrate-binding protein
MTRMHGMKLAFFPRKGWGEGLGTRGTMRSMTMQMIGSKLLAFALVATAALSAAPAWAQDKVKVGVFPVSSSLPYFVALERGFFKEQNIEP